MGSIRARSETGQLFFDFRYRGQRCREQTSLADTPANRKRLEKALAKIEADMATGKFDYETTFPGSRNAPRPQPNASPSGVALQPVMPVTTAAAEAAASATPSFQEFVITWLAEHRIEWRRSHMKVLDSTLDGHLLPEFGARPVANITKSDVLAFRAKLADKPGRTGAKLSNKRINNILGVLRQIMVEAADRYDFISPCANVKALKIRKSDVQPFTLDEVQRMLAVVRADWRDYFLVRFFTGMRTGEAHGLKWKYVDFERRLILIRETFVLGEDEYTKTDSSQRDIQMSQPVFEALKRQQEATGKRDYVFCNRSGQPIDNKNFSDRVYYPLLRHLGLDRRRPYQMRHTAATLWLASGEAPEWIARQLGHANTQMLFQVYSRYVPNLTRRDGSAMDRLLASRFASGNVASASGHESANDDASRAQPPPVMRQQAA
ncbi:Arm DNA-binding domain-containing protein [Roseateles puraquae]|uniref:Arm DNA-binding domain-containing protein n=1 Tax=Roseateles puraquae TaxID=431059 RepID=UPI0031DFFEE6